MNLSNLLKENKKFLKIQKKNIKTNVQFNL